MQTDNTDRQERTGKQIIDAGDDAEILADGGEEIDGDTDTDVCGLPAAHIETLSPVDEATVEVDLLDENLVQLTVRNDTINGLVWFDGEDVDELVEELREAQATLSTATRE